MMSNFYPSMTQIYTRDKGWANIEDLKCGDQVLNVDFHDNKKAFFAPIVRTERKEVDKAIFCGPFSFVPDTQILVNVDGSPVQKTWNDLYEEYKDKKKPVSSIVVYNSFNYTPEKWYDIDYPDTIILEILTSFMKDIIVLPSDNEGCAMKIRVPRDTIEASTVLHFLKEFKIAHSDDRTMGQNVISIYDNKVRDIINKFCVVTTDYDGVKYYAFNSKVIDLYPSIKENIINAYMWRDESPCGIAPFLSSVYDGFKRCLREDTEYQIYDGYANAVIRTILAPMAASMNKSMFSWTNFTRGTLSFMIDIDEQNDGISLIINNENELCEEETIMNVCAIETQTPYVLTNHCDLGYGAVTIISPVG